MINFDDFIQTDKEDYYNPNRITPQHPFRLSVIGPSNSGKTNIVLNIIMQCNCFERIYLYAKMLDENKYVFLI
jgi:Ni2+-binding GTPase involved in maturation of urease and hydrogenase